jgi:hypothetical protein
MKLTTHLHLVPISRMRGAIPPFPNTPPWLRAQPKAQRQMYLLPFTLYTKSCSPNLIFVRFSLLSHIKLQLNLSGSLRTGLRKSLVNGPESSTSRKLQPDRPCDISINFPPSQPIYSRSNLVLSSHLLLGLSNNRLPRGLHTTFRLLH